MKHFILLFIALAFSSCGDISTSSNARTMSFDSFYNKTLVGTKGNIHFKLVVLSNKSYTFERNDPNDYQKDEKQTGGFQETGVNRILTNENDGIFGEIKVSIESEECLRLFYQLEESETIENLKVCK